MAKIEGELFEEYSAGFAARTSAKIAEGNPPLKYTDPDTVTDVKLTTEPYYRRTASGYGPKIPTRYMLRINKRWHRVYMMLYGNSGSAYVLIKGEVHFLDTDTEHLLGR